MLFLTKGKTNWKYILIVVILALIAGGVVLWCSTKQELPYQPPEIKKPEKKFIILEGKIVKEDYTSAVVWAIETKGKERYILVGHTANEVIKMGEGTEVSLEGYEIETTITIPEAGEFHRYTRKAIEVTNYTKKVKDETSNWKTYRNEEYGFEIKYPEESRIVDSLFDENGIRIDLPFKNELVKEKYLQIKIDPETSRWRYACLDPDLGDLPVEMKKWVGDVPFEIRKKRENFNELVSYSTASDLHCYVFTFVLHSVKNEAFKEQLNKEKEIFDKIISTFISFIPEGVELP